ncbi:hypothetical protein PUN28_014173 [Cardiocondyla obscurior]
MRRMYGDENYISVLRAEFEKNDIELKYDEYHSHFADDLRHFQYDDYEFMDDDRTRLNEYEGRGFISRSLNDPIAKRMNKFSKLSEYTRPHFRPTERTTSTSTPPSTTTSSISSSTSTSATTILVTRTASSTTPASTSTEEFKTEIFTSSPKFSNATAKITNSDPTVNNTKITTTMTTSSLSSSSLSPPTPSPPSSLSSSSPSPSPSPPPTPSPSPSTSSSSPPSPSPSPLPSASPLPLPSLSPSLSPSSSVIVAQIVKEQNFSINEIPGQNDRIDEDLEELEPEVVSYSEKTTKTTLEEDTTLESVETTMDISTESLVNEEDEEEEIFDAATKITLHEELITSASHEQQQFRPRPEYRPTSTAETSTNTGGQLYQDVAAKDQQVLKLRGINACPVKEEVVAPFWANNTRGEVLALLNLYPFEQYVHWEKCTHENKQMYCREGCRCEQQYRLHRLLAYDPNNECRGIFSDWFKFPSCCVCRCYDLPLEFRVTSRSPRTSHKRRIKVQLPTRNRYP